MHIYRPVRTDTGTANFAKTNQFQTLRVGAYELETDQKNLYNKGCDGEEVRDTASEKSSSEETGSSEESMESSEGWPIGGQIWL
jgi:hypothetical protein